MKYLIHIIGMLIIWSSCASSNNTYYLDSRVDRYHFGSFVVLNKCAEYDYLLDPSTHNWLTNTLSSQLIQMGFEKEQDSIADLEVSYYLKVDTQYTQAACDPNYDDVLGGIICKARIQKYPVNTLILEFKDNHSNTIILQYAAKGILMKSTRITPFNLLPIIRKSLDKLDRISTPTTSA